MNRPYERRIGRLMQNTVMALAKPEAIFMHCMPIHRGEEVLDVEEVHGHRFGVYLVVNLTIGISPDLTVAEGDRIATRVEEVLLEEIDLMRRVFVPSANFPVLGSRFCC